VYVRGLRGYLGFYAVSYVSTAGRTGSFGTQALRKVGGGLQLDRIVLVRRRSPNWSELATEYESGREISIRRYKPPDVPGLPQDLPLCIQLWNATFSVNFFRCRQMLKEISTECLERVGRAIVMAEADLSNVRHLGDEARFMLFFFDDDDLFAPNIIDQLSDAHDHDLDIVVFPLIRLGDRCYTFVRRNHSARIVLGWRQDFRFRFQTNNYGITAKIALSEHLIHLQEHVSASLYASNQKLRDFYYDALISATNKTPCSLVMIRRLPADRLAYRRYVQRYVESLYQLSVPAELDWLKEPVERTAALFESALEEARAI
jgi:hypothetical protein